MTPESTSSQHIRRRIAASCVLGALTLVAAACTGSSDDGAVVEIGESADASSGFDDLEFGDSLDDLRDVSPAAESAKISLPGFQLIEWDDLIPAGFSSEQVLARYEDRITAAEPGSAEMDALYEEMNAEFDTASVNPELDTEKIQLAGFVAPLTYDGDDITEFLLVPYFGACIHVPPPPSNQTVMVTLAEGESLSLEESWGAVWVAGEMIATKTETDLATAGYSISAPVFGVYDSQ